MQPQFVIFEHRLIGLKFIEGDVPLVRAIGMTVEAVIFEERFDVLLKVRHAGRVGGDCSKTSQRKTGDDQAVKCSDQTHLLHFAYRRTSHHKSKVS